VKFWQVFSYLIVYDHLTRLIGVARVLHGSRDVAGILAGTNP
jgi:plasmid stabilization system protein ParE